MPPPGNHHAPVGTVDAGPVSESEQLYRRLLPEAWYRNPEHPIIPQKYFMPRRCQSPERPGDTDGISVNRASLTDPITASRRPDNGVRIPMARFSASSVYRIGLSVRPCPTEQDISHAVIPELNSLDRRDPEKEKLMDEWAMALRNCSTLIRPD